MALVLRKCSLYRTLYWKWERHLAKTTNFRDKGRRSFLSEAYKCQEAWNKRLENPILQKINLDEMFYEMERRINETKRPSVVDVDLFVNRVTELTHMDELEELVHKLRMSANTGDMLPSTPHAVIRTMLSLGHTDDLLRILNDRLNYGVFPDYYCSNLLMDTFLKNKNYRDAAKIAILQMLQEDWEHPVTTYLSLYSCHMYLKHPEPEPWEQEEEKEEDSGEEVRVRVKFIRNPYFDDHFDLRDPQLLIGKTLATAGRSLAAECDIGRTYEIAGWGLYNKWEKAKTALSRVSANSAIFKEGVSIFQDALNKLADSEDNQKGKLQEEFSSLFQKLEASGAVRNDDLSEALVNKLKQVVASHEQNDIQEQVKLYSEWEKLREEQLQKELEEYKRQEKLKLIESKKKELAEREELLFFFDNEEQLLMKLPKEKEVKPPAPGTKGSKRLKEKEDLSYVPPDVKKSFGS